MGKQWICGNYHAIAKGIQVLNLETSYKNDAEFCTNPFHLHRFVMRSPSIIPGNPNIQELGYVSPEFFITLEESQPNTNFNLNEQRQVSKTNGAIEFITYASFNVPSIASFAGATTNSKCFLVPLPDTIDAHGSKTIEIFDLLPGETLPTSMTFNDRLNPDNELSSVTFGGAMSLRPMSMENFVAATPNFGGLQQFQVRCQGDDARITFTLSLADPHPNLVIGNIIS